LEERTADNSEKDNTEEADAPDADLDGARLSGQQTVTTAKNAEAVSEGEYRAPIKENRT
jgi:hypothetical protein